MNFVVRWNRRRQDEDSFFEQVAGLVGRRDTANSARRSLVIVNAARLFRKALADVLRLPCHAYQGLLQLRDAGSAGRRCRLFRWRDIGGAALDVRRRRQLAYARRLALGTMHQMLLALIAKRIARSKPAFEAVSVVAEKIENYHVFGWLVPGTGLEPVWLAPRDFKSLVSTNFTTRARELVNKSTARAGSGIGRCSLSSCTEPYIPVAALRPHPAAARSLRFLHRL